MRYAITIAILLGTVYLLWYAVAVASSMSDDFELYTDNELITDSTTYDFASFPNGGSGGAGNPSDLWEADTGWLYADADGSGNLWGYSGEPDDWADKYFFRVNTQETATDQIVEFDHKSAAFGANGFTVEDADAIDVWIRYQTQYWLYVVQFDKRASDNNPCIYAKRKVPAEGWGGSGSLISNKGVYYILKTDSTQPVFGAGFSCITWNGIDSLIPGDPKLAHDGSSSSGTEYHWKATVETIAAATCGWTSNCVRIRLYRDGIFIMSWTDKNDGTNAVGATFQADWSAGYYTSVSGYTTDWGLPIYTAGKSGIRADNIKVWIDNFSMTDGAAAQCNDGLDNDSDTFTDYPADAGCSSTADNDETNVPSAPPTVKSRLGLKGAATVIINTGRVIMH